MLKSQLEQQIIAYTIEKNHPGQKQTQVNTSSETRSSNLFPTRKSIRLLLCYREKLHET